MSEHLFMRTIHVNKFKASPDDEWDINSEENIHLLENFQIMKDGSVVSVAKDKVQKFLDEKDTMLIRMGYKKMPKEPVKTEDDFWRIISYFVDIDEY